MHLVHFQRVFICSQYDNVPWQVNLGRPKSTSQPGCQLIDNTLWGSHVIPPINPPHSPFTRTPILKEIFLSLAYKASFETLCGRDKGSTVCSLEKVKQESLRTHQSTSLVKRYINDSFFGNTKWQVLTFFKNYIRVNIPSPTYAKTVWTVKPWFFWQSIIVSQISFTKDWEIVSPFNLTWVTRCCENKLNFLNIIF